MGGMLATVQNTADGMRENVATTLTTVTNMIGDFRRDTSGTMVNVTNESLESLRRITHRADQTAFLLTNAILAITAAIALSLLLFLTNFSPFLRNVVWIMFAILCAYMILTYIGHSQSPPLSTTETQEEGKVVFPPISYIFPSYFEMKREYEISKKYIYN